MSSNQQQYGEVANYNITPKTRGDGAPSALEVDSNGNLLINLNTNAGILSSAPLNGQAKIAITSTAVQLSSNALKNGVVVTAKSSNAAPILVGGSGVTNTVDGTGNGTILEAGMSMSWAVSNTNALWINGSSGDIVSFSGS